MNDIGTMDRPRGYGHWRVLRIVGMVVGGLALAVVVLPLGVHVLEHQRRACPQQPSEQND